MKKLYFVQNMYGVVRACETLSPEEAVRHCQALDDVDYGETDPVLNGAYSVHEGVYVGEYKLVSDVRRVDVTKPDSPLAKEKARGQTPMESAFESGPVDPAAATAQGWG